MPASHHVEVLPSPPPPPPHMSHDDLRLHEYEDIQELRAINRNVGNSPPDESNTSTHCPVKTPSPPQYEELHNGDNPPDDPNIVAQYYFTQCPAYDATS